MLPNGANFPLNCTANYTEFKCLLVLNIGQFTSYMHEDLKFLN